MADGEELEYDSDPEDALRPSMMRRREASDDENGEGSSGERDIKTIRRERLRVGSDDESEGEGSGRGYAEEEEYEDQGEEEMLEEEVDEEGVEGGNDASVLERSVIVGGRSRDAREMDGAAVLLEEYGQSSGGDVYREKNQAQEGGKKETEPFAVPTAGAFYMHDDRFVENGKGRHRRMPGGRRLWESKDDQAWVHDRFEEMKLQDRRNEDGRMPRGRFRGRGSRRSRGAGRGYDRGNRPRAYYGDNSNQNAIKSVRGRGPVRYEPLSNNESYSNQSKRTPKTQEVALDNISAKFPQTSDGRPESVAPRKQTFASSLSSASPPFYPSGSSNQDMAATQNREMQTGSNTKSLSSTMQMENYFSAPHPSSSFRGKTIVDSVGFDRLHLDDSDQQVSGKAPVHPSLHASSSSLSLSTANKSPSYKVQEKNSISNSMHNHPTSFNQVGRMPWQNQPPIVQQKPVQNQGPHSLKISNQQVAQHLLIGNQVASPPPPSVGISSEGEEVSLPGTGTTNSTFGKGKHINQGAGRGPFLYGGAQIIGPTEAVGLPHGDQNFSGTPALLPVMQFSGQHPRGLGVPAVGMALPGYVAQPGFGNSEMTWVPVLAGAAGALGASYCSPYITLDGNYYGRPSGQASTSTSSIKEASGTKPANASKPPQKNEIVNVEFGQRQNKPRRYSEMNFGQ